jgi:hypothetical protein
MRDLKRYLNVTWAAALTVGWILTGTVLMAAPHDHGAENHGAVYDTRYHHNRYYPPRGAWVDQLPHGYRSVYWGHDRYYFHGGVWYRPYGPRFVVFAPPFGLVVPFLPAYYSTVWFGGAPYYYADDVYYRRHDNGYEVTEAPGDQPESTSPAPPAEDLFIYPKADQNPEQQAKDRYQCHRWAVDQTGFDPSEPGGGVSAAENGRKRDDYRRAMTACLEARDYTVK